MPLLLVGAVWMLGSGPSMTEDEAAEGARERGHHVGNVARTRQIIT